MSGSGGYRECIVAIQIHPQALVVEQSGKSALGS